MGEDQSSVRRAEIDAAIKAIKELQARTGRMSLADLLSARHDGHKY
jgi:hypothetical protein